MFDLKNTQQALKQFGFDGWLLYDFRGSNVLARRVLDLEGAPNGSRRWCYAIPKSGEPLKLVHRIEDKVLDHLPGKKLSYLRWEEWEAGIQRAAAGMKTVAMEYSPRNANPYVAKVDAGMVELVQSFGSEVVSSGDLIQLFESVWDQRQWEMHQAAGDICDRAFTLVWRLIAEEVRQSGGIEEAAVQDAIMAHFAEHNLTTYSPPIVGVGPHSGDPHYETGTGKNTLIREGDLVLVDLWAKQDKPRATYADMTRMGFVGETVPAKYAAVFQIVADAREAAIELVESAFAEGRALQGWEVDQACRAVIDEAGYEDAFFHRTGHNIGQEVHGNGAHMDNLETKEERLVLPMTCFSIEPGIYLEEFGCRSEVDVFVDAERKVHVTYGNRQGEIEPILRGR